MIIVQNKNFYLRAAIIAVLLSSVYLKMYLIFKPTKKFPEDLLYYLPGNKYYFKRFFNGLGLYRIWVYRNYHTKRNSF